MTNELPSFEEFKEFQKFKEQKNKEVEEKEFKEKVESLQVQIQNKISKIYILFILTVIGIVLITIILFVLRISIIWIFIWIIFAIPIFLMSHVITLVKLYKDKDKLKNKILPKLSNYVIMANIFTEQKKLKTIAFMVHSTFFVYNGGEYYLDEKAVWLDINKRANFFYREGYPNPLIFDFEKYILEYDKAIDKDNVKDRMGNKIDVSYSSENIQKAKKDKFFEELHKSDNNLTGLLIVITVIEGIIIIFITLAQLLKK